MASVLQKGVRYMCSVCVKSLQQHWKWEQVTRGPGKVSSRCCWSGMLPEWMKWTKDPRLRWHVWFLLTTHFKFQISPSEKDAGYDLVGFDACKVTLLGFQNPEPVHGNRRSFKDIKNKDPLRLIIVSTCYYNHLVIQTYIRNFRSIPVHSTPNPVCQASRVLTIVDPSEDIYGHNDMRKLGEMSGGVAVESWMHFRIECSQDTRKNIHCTSVLVRTWKTWSKTDRYGQSVHYLKRGDAGTKSTKFSIPQFPDDDSDRPGDPTTDSEVDVLSSVKSLFKGVLFLPSGHEHYDASTLQNKFRRKNWLTSLVPWAHRLQIGLLSSHCMKYSGQ